MNRIETTFQRLRDAGRKGLVGYLTAGDPDPERSEQDLRDAIDAGLDVLDRNRRGTVDARIDPDQVVGDVDIGDTEPGHHCGRHLDVWT